MDSSPKKNSHTKYPHLKNLNRFHKDYGWLTVLFTLITVCAGAVALAFPFAASQILMDLTGGAYNSLAVSAAVLFGLVIVNAALVFFASWLKNRISNNIRFDIREEATSRIISMKLSNVYDKGTGFFLERLSEDTTEVGQVPFDVRTAQIDILLNLSFVGYITVLNPLLGLIFATGLAILVFLEYFRVSQLLKNKKHLKRSREMIKSTETEILKGLKEIKGQGARETILKNHSVANQRITDARYRRTSFDNKVSGSISAVKAVTDLAILLFAGLYLLPNHFAELAAVLVVYTYKGNIYGLISSMARIRDTYVNGELAAKRLNDVLLAPDYEYDKFGIRELEGCVKDIEFKNVAFEYRPDVPVLRDISLKIDGNGLYGFVGKSGSGKSTIFGLLTNFFQARSGQILLNGVPYESLSENSVRNAITPVLQDPYIFNDTIINNVKFSKSDATFDMVVEACRAAKLHDEIMPFQNKYETVIGESGSTLSGGQKQRLEIARALLKSSSVLLLDEATSALDKTNLSVINELMQSLSKQKIVMVIAHRLGIMRRCDKVFVLDEGRMLASGTHEELLETCEYYQELFKKQAALPETAGQ